MYYYRQYTTFSSSRLCVLGPYQYWPTKRLDYYVWCRSQMMGVDPTPHKKEQQHSTPSFYHYANECRIQRSPDHPFYEWLANVYTMEYFVASEREHKEYEMHRRRCCKKTGMTGTHFIISFVNIAYSRLLLCVGSCRQKRIFSRTWLFVVWELYNHHRRYCTATIHPHVYPPFI